MPDEEEQLPRDRRALPNRFAQKGDPPVTSKIDKEYPAGESENIDYLGEIPDELKLKAVKILKDNQFEIPTDYSKVQVSNRNSPRLQSQLYELMVRYSTMKPVIDHGYFPRDRQPTGMDEDSLEKSDVGKLGSIYNTPVALFPGYDWQMGQVMNYLLRDAHFVSKMVNQIPLSYRYGVTYSNQRQLAANLWAPVNDNITVAPAGVQSYLAANGSTYRRTTFLIKDGTVPNRGIGRRAYELQIRFTPTVVTANPNYFITFDGILNAAQTDTLDELDTTRDVFFIDPGVVNFIDRVEFSRFTIHSTEAISVYWAQAQTW